MVDHHQAVEIRHPEGDLSRLVAPVLAVLDRQCKGAPKTVMAFENAIP